MDVQGYLKVQAALREWDPIGCGVPPDEYDSYAAPVVRLLDSDAPKEEIIAYLRDLCVEHMGCVFDQGRAEKVVADLQSFWPPWKLKIAEFKANGRVEQ